MTGASETPPIADLGGLTSAGRSTWEAIHELSVRIPIDSWAVVGGQMVAIHAALAGVEPPRVTNDGDIVVDVRVHQRRAMTDVATALSDLGFTVETSPELVTRFVRGVAKIDLIAPEGMGRNVLTSPPGHAVQAPGASQALTRTQLVIVDWQTGRTTVRCPSLLGAIVAKAAGASEIRSLSLDEKRKHQQDLAFLLSLAALGDLRTMAASTTAKDRTRIQRATAPMTADATHPAWSTTPNRDDTLIALRRLTGP